VENKRRRRASCTAAPYLGTGSTILLFGPFGFASKLFTPIGFCILASLKDWLLVSPQCCLAHWNWTKEVPNYKPFMSMQAFVVLQKWMNQFCPNPLSLFRRTRNRRSIRGGSQGRDVQKRTIRQYKMYLGDVNYLTCTTIN
jgi:hypothetical protein